MFSPKDVIGTYTYIMICHNCDTMVGYSVSDMIMQPLTYVDVTHGRTTQHTMDSTDVPLHLLYTYIEIRRLPQSDINVGVYPEV